MSRQQPKDNVEMIVERLRHSRQGGGGLGVGRDAASLANGISADAVREAQSSVRVFNVRHPQNLGRSDNRWRRACCLTCITMSMR